MINLMFKPSVLSAALNGASPAPFGTPWGKFKFLETGYASLRNEGFVGRYMSFRKPALIARVYVGIMCASIREQLQVFGQVVETITVTVMNSFSGLQVSPKYKRHHNTVFQNTAVTSCKGVFRQVYEYIRPLTVGLGNPLLSGSRVSSHSSIIQDGE